MKLNSARKIIACFPRRRVAVLGDVMLDSAIWGVVERISPEAPVPIVRVQRETFMPGGAANVANNIRSLSGQVDLIGLVGNDSNRLVLEKELRNQKLSARHLLVDKSRPTIRKTRVMGIPQHQLLRIDEEVSSPLRKSVETEIISRVKRIVKTAGVLIISDYAKGSITLKVAQAAIRNAQQNHIPVIVDPKPVHKEYYIGAQVITPNRAEVLAMAPNSPNDIDAAKNLAQELSAQIILTRSEKGMAVVAPGCKPKYLRTKTKEVFDVSGAGDTVVAVLALALASGASLPAAATLANYAAGIVVGKVGTATLNTGELKRALKNDRL